MGRMMGAFDRDNDMLDRPDLNKCPDCGCFFEQDNCPLCGKPCPEEMRAGNRAAPKKQKYKYDNGYRTVMFVDWYHRWWFIALMAFVSPLISIILLITSPHKRAHKIIAVIVAVLYWILSTVVSQYIFGWIFSPEPPVNTSLTKEEYIAACEEVSPEDFYRTPEKYEGKFVKMTLTVTKVLNSGSGYEYDSYYLCRADGGTFELLIRNCLQDGAQNFMAGDTVTVYGEGAGNVTAGNIAADGLFTTHTAPCINFAYAVRESKQIKNSTFQKNVLFFYYQIIIKSSFLAEILSPLYKTTYT